jgi:ribonuclease HII
MVQLVVGIDEVGRGSWAGPLVAGAIILYHNPPISRVPPWKWGDSKRLTKHQRMVANAEIQKDACVGLGWVWPAEIDRLGLTASVKLAMERSLAKLPASYDEIIIDGNYNFLAENPKSRAVVKADESVPAVSAASIVAKVARDEYMAKIAVNYPEYAFEKHVGYGTRLHQEMLKLHGVCDIHRKSYKPIAALLRRTYAAH